MGSSNNLDGHVTDLDECRLRRSGKRDGRELWKGFDAHFDGGILCIEYA